jgi:hypothetical protein
LRREIGRATEIRDATLVEVDVEVAVQLYSGFRHSIMKPLVEQIVNDFFIRSKRALNETLYPSDLMRELTDLTGIRAADVVFTPSSVGVGEFPIYDATPTPVVLTGGTNDL